MNETRKNLPVAVIGGGPVGLAAAAHLLERGLDPLVFERGAAVGEHLRQYGHVRLFSPWRYNIDQAAARLLREHGWVEPDLETLPNAEDVVTRYLEPFAELPEIRRRLRLNARVMAISREGFDKVKTKGRENSPFVIRYAGRGGVHEVKTQGVIDASGTWSQPNPLGANGMSAIGEAEHRDRIYYGIPDVIGKDSTRYAGRRVMVVGAGHSAANSLLALAELARVHPRTRLVWAVRGGDLSHVFGGGAADALPARGELGASLRRLQVSGGLEFVFGLRITRIERVGEQLSVIGSDTDGGEMRIGGIDEIICATGQRPDYSIASELRLKLDPWLESSEALGPLIDPNEHSCGTVRPHGHRELAHPEPGFYTAGVKSYGRAPTFLLATGYEQVRSIAAALAGDLEAADRVELDLPETGVCSAGGGDTDGGACCGVAPKRSIPREAPAGGCCGGPAPGGADACCVKDADAKAAGQSGCGCSTPSAGNNSAAERELVGTSCCG